jgi:hypothetical protein
MVTISEINRCVGWDDVEFIRAKTFSAGNLTNRFQSVNVDIRKRIRLL